MSEDVPRWRDRKGAEGLYDRRLGRVSARRAGVDEVVALLDLFDTRYRHFTAWHFWEKLVEHDVTRSYNWVRRGARPDRAGAAARRAPPQAAAPADGRHDVAPGRLQGPQSIYSAFFAPCRLCGVGVVCRYRASHYWHTPEAGGKVDKEIQPRCALRFGVFAGGPGPPSACSRWLQPVPERGLPAGPQCPRRPRSIGFLTGAWSSVCQPPTRRMVICPEAIKAQNSMAAVSALGRVFASHRRGAW